MSSQTYHMKIQNVRTQWRHWVAGRGRGPRGPHPPSLLNQKKTATCVSCAPPRCILSPDLLHVLETVANEVLCMLRPLRKRKDYIDATATSSLPIDGPQNVHAIWTTADGNCFSRSLSRVFTGDESMHVEIKCYMELTSSFSLIQLENNLSINQLKSTFIEGNLDCFL